MAGLARYGFLEEAAQVIQGLLATLNNYPSHRLPELFAGYSVDEAPFPVEYPTANQPQAWAAGSVFLLVSAMLGLHPDSPPFWKFWKTPFLSEGLLYLRLRNVWAGRQRTTVEIDRAVDGSVQQEIDEAAAMQQNGRPKRTDIPVSPI